MRRVVELVGCAASPCVSRYHPLVLDLLGCNPLQSLWVVGGGGIGDVVRDGQFFGRERVVEMVGGGCWG